MQFENKIILSLRNMFHCTIFVNFTTNSPGVDTENLIDSQPSRTSTTNHDNDTYFSDLLVIISIIS